VRAFGSGSMTNPMSDFANADTLLIIGSNLAVNHTPALRWIWEAKDKGAKVIVADPRQTATASLADTFLQLKPGSDVALLNGMAHVIIHEELFDSDFLNQRTREYEAFFNLVRGYTPEKSAQLTGLRAEQIIEAARDYAKAGAATIIYCMGITQHTTGTDNVAALANLAMLTGNIGKPGSGVCPMRGQNNVQGACDMGSLPTVFPGYALVIDPGARNRYIQAWNTEKLPKHPGLTLMEMMNNAILGHIKTFLIMGEDPLVSDPNSNHVRDALASLDFLAVMDIFMTDTAKAADIVLPSVAWAEKEGSFTNTERRVQWFDQAIDPVGEAKSDLWIINQLGKRLGFDLGGDDAKMVLSQINQTVPAYGGITKERASQKGGVPWPCPSKDHPGTPILHVGKFTHGKGLFVPVDYKPPAEIVSKEFPFVLNTGRLAVHFNTGTMTHRSPSLEDRAGDVKVDIHPGDAVTLDILDGEIVNISTIRGSLNARANITKMVEAGEVFIPFHFSGVNCLTTDTLDEQSKIPAFKVAACRIKKGETV